MSGFTADSSTASLKIALFYTNIFLCGGTKLKFPGVAGPLTAPPEFLYPSMSSFARCAEIIGNFFDFVLSLERSTFLLFCGVDWTRLIAVIILSIRISFPMPECLDWDASWARSKMHLSEFLAAICTRPDLRLGADSLDILSATRVIMGMVKEKYDREVSRYTMEALHSANAGRVRCPMLDGSLNQYIPTWDGVFHGASTGPSAHTGTSSEPVLRTEGVYYSEILMGIPNNAENQHVYQDPWEIITSEWASG
jgi:hypothetical protein